MSYRERYQKHWETENVLEDGRVVDLGASPGPSASDLIDIYNQRNKRHRASPNYLRIRILLAALGSLILVGMAIILAKYTTIFRLNVALLQGYGNLAMSVAMVILTSGLLITTWKYTTLTARMLDEMRSQRQLESEPQITMSLWPWLDEDKNPKTVDDFISRIYIRNVGPVIALDPSLHYDMRDLESDRNKGGSMSVGSGTDVLSIKPGQEIVLRWGCTKEDLRQYDRGRDSTEPFVTLRLKYRDSWNRPCSITQDYRIGRSDKPPFMLTLMSEFVATASEPRWRTARDSFGIWVSA